MPENTILIVIAVLVVISAIAIIAYYIARFMRGTIKLSLPRKAFNSGEPVTGSFDLHTKKAIQGNKLFVSLIGTQVVKTYDDGKTRTRNQEIYRDEVLVEDAKAYAPGFKNTYNFEISTPDMRSPEFLTSAVGQVLTAAFKVVSNRSIRLTWKVEARLDAKGIDLATAKPVSINAKELI